MLDMLRVSSLLGRLTLTRIFLCRNRFTIKNNNDNDRAAVTPLAISHIPKSEFLSEFFSKFLSILAGSASSKQIKSQHELPILNDLHASGGVHKTALQPFACPFSQMQILHISGPGI